MDHNALLQSAIAAGLIDPERHSALLRNAARFAREANIPLTMLYTSMVKLCSEVESKFMDGLMTHAASGVSGLVLYGPQTKVSVTDRFAVMAAVCLRNYLSARVMFLQDVFDSLRADDMPQPTLLLIPDFYQSGKAALDIPDTDDEEEEDEEEETTEDSEVDEEELASDDEDEEDEEEDEEDEDEEEEEEDEE